MTEALAPVLDADSQVVIVGGSVAGAAVASTLRREGFEGTVKLVSAEDELPYDRPPLSKAVLTGDMDESRLTLPLPDDVETILGVEATCLDSERRLVQLANGESLSYDGLAITTGVRPRPLPVGHDLDGVHLLRTLADARALRRDFQDAKRLVVIGGGLIGCEVAASARKLGLEVVITEVAPLPMLRQFGDKLAVRVMGMHERQGVAILTEATVDRLEATDGRVRAVVLTDGRTLPADLVLVSIGSLPNIEWLAGSGVALGDGVETDTTCLAAPNIVAAGDVAKWLHPVLGQRIRIEHRTNAAEQGMAAARTLLGRPETFAPTPYFWTDQYDAKISVFGAIPAAAEPVLVDGAFEERFVTEFHEAGQVVGVLGWNSQRELVKRRTRIGHPV